MAILSPGTGDVICASFCLKGTGLIPMGRPSFAEWQEVGQFITRAHNSCTLWLGDWINYGETSFGEKYLEAIIKTGLDYGTLRNAAYTARRIALSDRSDKLGYKHHEMVASFPRPVQRSLLAEAERKHLSVRDFLHTIHCIKRKNFVAPPLPKNTYSVLYADPPWDIESSAFEKWPNPIPYTTMTLDDLKTMPMPQQAPDCVLFLWATLSVLPTAFELLSSWGFTYHIAITWNKGSGFCLNGFHRMSELLLVGYSGILGNVIKQHGSFIPTVFSEAKTTHSTKPIHMYELIEAHTYGRRIELFARNYRSGWDSWGNELPATSVA